MQTLILIFTLTYFYFHAVWFEMRCVFFLDISIQILNASLFPLPFAINAWHCNVLNVPCRAGEAALSSSSTGPGGLSPLETKPVERQVEARPVDDSFGSMVRCLYFAKTFLITGM
jgi:hypothetical protein